MNAFVSSATAQALVRIMLVLGILIGAFHAPPVISEMTSGEQSDWMLIVPDDHATLDGSCADCSKCEEACVAVPSPSSIGIGRASPVHALASMRPNSGSQPLAKPPRG